MGRQGSNRSGWPVRNVNQERPKTPIRIPDPASPGPRGRDSRKTEENPGKPKNSASQDAPGATISSGSIGKVAHMPASAGMCAEQGDGASAGAAPGRMVGEESEESTREAPALLRPRSGPPPSREARRGERLRSATATMRPKDRGPTGRRWPGHRDVGRAVSVRASDGQFPGKWE